MSSEQFWVQIWRTIVIGLVVMICSFSACSVKRNSQVIEMVEAGADPIDARISLSNELSLSEILTHELGRKLAE